MRIDTTQIQSWRIATKVQPIKAKHITACVLQGGILSKVLLQTLEGNEPLRQEAMVCEGITGDVWLQDPAKLFKKYTVIGIDSFGWLNCEPKPENEVNALDTTGMSFDDPSLTFTIVGQWGEEVNGEKNVQRGVSGDFICQNQTDPTDVWIVKRRLFLNSYKFKN